MEPIAIAYIQNCHTNKPCITFYAKGTVEVANNILGNAYQSHGINVPNSKIKDYPEIQNREYKRVYPDDGDLFKKVFLEIELPRLKDEYKYVKA